VNNDFPIRYIEPVFRPPSEADSLILPITNGCSWNKCTYCEMYTAPQKKFALRDEDETLESIRRLGQGYGRGVQRVFLGDGDAMALSTRRLMAVLDAIRTHLPGVRRISSYCLPRNVRSKSVADLTELREAGLSLAYVGAESGDDEVLRKVNKGETFETTRDALDKLGAAGITRSVMLLNGLGGPTLSRAHAENSARLANATQPEFLATLVVSFPQGEERFRANFPEWEPLDLPALFREMETFCRHWSCAAPCSAATTPPTGWCSRARWVRRRTACWPRCAPRSPRPRMPHCARPGCAACSRQPPSRVSSPATAAASAALFSISAMFAARLLPPVSSFTRASRKGVTGLAGDALRRGIRQRLSRWHASITSRGISCASGTGLAITMPPRRPSAHWACIARATAPASSSRCSSAKPLSRT
jgi:hypothetical protein